MAVKELVHDIKFGTRSLDILVSLTHNMRLMVAMMDRSTLEKFIEILGSVIHGILDTPGIPESLKSDMPGGCISLRQCDLKTEPDSPPVFKTFTFWNKESQCWHLLVELPEETYWEENKVDHRMN